MYKRSSLLRLLGLALLGLLLWRLDTRQIAAMLGGAEWALVVVAFAMNFPQVLLKAMRWRWLLKVQGIRYGVMPASLAYFGSIFIGLFTPGRLGEFVKAVHVSRDCGVPSGRAFSSVLADRLFDLYALMVVGGAGLLSLGVVDTGTTALVFGATAMALVLPVPLLLSNTTFGWVQAIGNRFGKMGRKLFGPEGWVVELRSGLKQLTIPWALLALALTAAAYAVLYTQAYLLALALGFDIGVLQISFAVALGSLITLIPVSISGIGTREAGIVAYLGTAGVAPEASLSFSLLVFVTFYLGTGMIGSVAWLLKPMPLKNAVQKVHA